MNLRVRSRKEAEMKIVDLSHVMNVHTPGWVGYAGNKMYYAQNLQTQMIVAQRIDTALHVGTHFDGAMHATEAKYHLGQVLRHRKHPFRGVVFDVDARFSSTEDWYEAIPEHSRPRRDQPFYHLLAENDQGAYVAYVSEQNLLPDASGTPLRHPQVGELFTLGEDGNYRPLFLQQPH